MGKTMLGRIAFVIVLANGAVYWPKIKAMRVPLRPVGHQSVMVSSMLVAVVAFVRGPGVVDAICAALALLVGGLFLVMTLASGMPHKVLTVAVGQPFLDFTVKDADGNNFMLSSLKGTPFLLKFFRGHW